MQRFFRSLPWLAVPAWLGPLAFWLAYHPWPVLSHLGGLLLTFDLLLFLGALVAAAVFLWTLWGAWSGRFRPRTKLAMAQALVFLLSFVGGCLLGQVIWRDRVEAVVVDAQPVLVAIQRFTIANGRPPQTLDELAPRGQPPTTGIGAYPQYHYVVGEPERYDGNPWVLIVTPPCHPMGFDSLLYFPRQNYPQIGHGGWIERIGAWGYVHE